MWQYWTSIGYLCSLTKQVKTADMRWLKSTRPSRSTRKYTFGTVTSWNSACRDTRVHTGSGWEHTPGDAAAATRPSCRPIGSGLGCFCVAPITPGAFGVTNSSAMLTQRATQQDDATERRNGASLFSVSAPSREKPHQAVYRVPWLCHKILCTESFEYRSWGPRGPNYWCWIVVHFSRFASPRTKQIGSLFGHECIVLDENLIAVTRIQLESTWHQRCFLEPEAAGSGLAWPIRWTTNRQLLTSNLLKHFQRGNSCVPS